MWLQKTLDSLRKYGRLVDCLEDSLNRVFLSFVVMALVVALSDSSIKVLLQTRVMLVLSKHIPPPAQGIENMHVSIACWLEWDMWKHTLKAVLMPES